MAWLSNLFAPKAEAQLAGSLGSSEAAAAIEAIVNTGAASLGVAGSIAINPSQKDPRKERPDQKRPKKDERTDRKAETKPEPKERTEKDTRQKERGEPKEKHEEKYQKREAGSRREPREPMERTEALTKERVRAEQRAEQHAEPREQIRAEQRAEQKDPAEKARNVESKHAEPRHNEKADTKNQPSDQKSDHKSETKAEKHSEPKSEKTAEPKANKNKDGFNVRVERLAKDDGDVPTVHLSLDGSKGEPKRKDTTSPTPVAVTADTAVELNAPPVGSTEKAEKKAKPKAEKALNAEEKPAQAPVAEMHSETAELRAEKPAKAKKPAKKPKTLTLSETEKAAALIIARETNRAVNDPRVIKVAVTKQPTTPTSNAGAFIKARLDNAEERLAKDGFVACFIAAMNAQTAPTATFDFSNFGYEPLSEKAESAFFERIATAASFGTGAGKTDAPARPPKQRAVNDPRGEHPAFLADTAKTAEADAPVFKPSPEPEPAEVTDMADTAAKSTVTDVADAHSTSETTHIDTADSLEPTSPVTSTDNDAQPEDEQAKDTQSLTEKAEHAIDELIGTLKDGLSRLGDILPDNEPSAEDRETTDTARTGETAGESEDAGKTSPASYKNMIENIAEQLLPQTGILKLATPKLATPKKPAKKSTKVAIKVPKADKKPKSEVRKKPTKPAEEGESSSDNPSEG